MGMKGEANWDVRERSCTSETGRRIGGQGEGLDGWRGLARWLGLRLKVARETGFCHFLAVCCSGGVRPSMMKLLLGLGGCG